MKTIYCYKCGCKVGEITKGTYKKGAKGVCEECIELNNDNGLDAFSRLFGNKVV